MRTSESIVNISPALLKAQREIGSAKKESENPFYRSTYADLGEVMRVCKKPCNDNGIIIIQPVESDENGNYVETVLLHESGEFIASRMRLAVKSENDPQALGSSISYAKRYSLQALLLIPSEDDDGEKATTHHTVYKDNTPTKTAEPKPQGQVTQPQIAKIFVLLKEKGVTEERLKEKYGVAHMDDLTKDQASKIIEQLINYRK